MIFVTDDRGANVFTSPDWTRLTGQIQTDGYGDGWAEQIHPDDRALIVSTVQRAIAGRLPFTTHHRLRFSDGTYHWVVSGAVPAFCPGTGTFMGLMGSVTKVAPRLSASASVGAFAPPEPNPVTMPSSRMELVIDHLLLARSFLSAEHPGSDAIVGAIDLALYLQGQELPKQ